MRQREAPTARVAKRLQSRVKKGGATTSRIANRGAKAECKRRQIALQSKGEGKGRDHAVAKATTCRVAKRERKGKRGNQGRH